MVATVYNPGGSGFVGLGTGGGSRNICYANGRYWAFFMRNPTGSGNNLISYCSSTDGTTWNTPTDIHSGGGSFPVKEVDIFLSGMTTLTYVIQDVTAGEFYWGQGALNSDGTITWSVADTGLTPNHTLNGWSATVFVDKNNNTFLCIPVTGGPGFGLEVWELPNGGGVWSNILFYTTTSPLAGRMVQIPNSEHLAIVLSNYGLGGIHYNNITIIISIDGGSTWTSSSNGPLAYTDQGNSTEGIILSSVAIRDTVYIAYKSTNGSGAGGDTYFVSWEENIGWSTPVYIYGDGLISNYTTLTTSGNALFTIFFQEGTGAIADRRSVDIGQTWKTLDLDYSTYYASGVSAPVLYNGNKRYTLFVDYTALYITFGTAYAETDFLADISVSGYAIPGPLTHSQYFTC